MKANATGSSSTEVSDKHQSHGPSFAKVFDGRKQPVRGLWVRNGRFYAQLQVENPTTGQKRVRRVPLVDKSGKAVQTVPQAVAELERLKVKRTDNALPLLRRCPKFAVHAKNYLEFISAGEGMKKKNTIGKEKTILKRWTEHLGHLRLDQIRPAHVNAFITKRLKAGTKPRTINLDVIGFRNAMKQGIADGWLQYLPTLNLRPLKVVTPKRSLVTTADVDRFCAAAFETRKNDKGEAVPVTKNAQQFVDYIRLLAYSGARRNEALALRWDDVDQERGQLTIGATGDTKNSRARTVDFNPKLKAHIEDMASRLAPDSKWVFPSPQRGSKDIHAESFRESLMLVRKQAGMPHFNLHDLRHHFISMAVMSGLDFMTISSWVGHRDGGVLIGKVYAHLADAHKKEQAARLNFGPVVLEQATND